MRINKHDTQGTKPLLGKGELGYDDYAAGGDVGRVYVGTGSENIALAEKSEIDSHVNRVDNPHNVTKAQVGLGSVDNTADVDKNVLSATKWTTARTITLSGDIAGSVSMDGTANVSITTTVQPNSVALGTDTTGNYVAGITQGTGITVSGTAGEGWSPTVAITNVGTAGTYTKVTTNAQGQVTSGTSLSASDIPSLDASKITTGIIDAARLPAFVDDVLEFANQASFPATGESGKIYVALDTNKTYRWSGSVYVYITSGAVDSVNGMTGVVTVSTITGNAGTATTLQTARTIATSGDVVGTATSFNGSANITIPMTLANVGTAGTYTKVTTDAKGRITSGTTLSASDIPTLNQSTTGSAATLTTARTVQTNLGSTASASFDGSANITPGVTGTLPVGNGGTGATTLTGIVKGNGTGAMTAATAGTDYVIPSGSISGNAGTATKLQTSRNIALAGAIVGSVNFDGSADVSISTTLGAQSFIQSSGLNTSWGATSGTSTGAVNAIMGTSSSATWLLSGTSGGVFRSGIQSLDSNGTLRLYSNSNYIEINGNQITGNISTASALATGRTIGMTGDVTWTSASFNGSANVTGTATLANSGVTAGTYKSVTVDAKGRVTAGTNPTTLSGYGITDAQTTLVSGTNIKTINGTSVLGSGDISTIQTTITGNAGTATTLQTARNIALTGDVTGNVNFDGSANVSIAATIAENSVALGTDTTGNYVAGVTQGTGISVTGTAGEGWTPVVSLTNVGTAGTYRSVTTDAQGRVTAGTNPTTLSGYGITDAQTASRTSATFTTAANTWYRIATSLVGIQRNSAEFAVDWEVSGNHGSTRFAAACHYGEAAGVSLMQTNYAKFGTGGITEARIVYHTTFNGNYAYVEVKFAAALTSVVVNVEMQDPLGWTLVTPSTAGSIPSGYTSYVHTFVPSAAITAGTYPKVTINQEGRVISGSAMLATDIPDLDASKITTGTLPVARGGTGVTTSTGTGSVVLSTSPTLTTPNIGVATGTSFNSITGLASAAPIVAGTAAVGTSTLTARQDHVHPAQTTITGNAGTATTLQTARAINGVNFDGSAAISISDLRGSNYVSGGSEKPNSAVFGAGKFSYQMLSSPNLGTGVGTWNDVLWVSSYTGNDVKGSNALIMCKDSDYVGVTRSNYDATAWSAPKQLAYTTSNITGNASTATALQTARNIGGVSFNGTADITLPGVNAAGNQNTSGNAATATKLQTARLIGGVSFDGTTNIDLPGVNTTGNQSTTGNAATATVLQTARTIGTSGDVTGTATSFNGSANITIPMTLANSGVTAGTYSKVTVDAKGRVTAGAIPTMEDIPDATFKRSVRCATTANITLSGTQTIDGIAVVAGDRVLVKEQTTASQNGIYVVAAGAWTRSLDADSSSEIASALVAVDSGTANGGKLFDNDFKTTDTLGTTAMTWNTNLDDGSLLTAGSTSVGIVKYNGTTAVAGQFDGGTTTPTGSTRLNYGGYFYPTSLNLTGSDDTTTASSHVFVETASDGYVRPKTLANFKTEIFASPTLVTPNIGVATGTSFNSITGLSSTTPSMNGTAAVGTGVTVARADHVHPSDTTKVTKVASTDNAVVRFNGTTGDVQNSSVTIDDNGNIGSGTQSFNGFGGSGFKNYIINGNFDVWQRGITQTSTGYDSDDRWRNGNAGSTKTHSRVACTDTERALFNASYFSRTVVTSVAGANNQVLKEQYIENVTRLAGKTVTLSFWAKADSNKNIGVNIAQVFGTGGSPSSIVYGTTQIVALTSTWQKKSITVTIPSIVGKTLGTDGEHTSFTALEFYFDQGSATTGSVLGQQSGTFDIAQVQLEEGSVATPFENRPYGLELSLCQRYCRKIGGMIDASNVYLSSIILGGTARTVIMFKDPMRVAPSFTYYGNLANYTVNGVTGSSLVLIQASSYHAAIDLALNTNQTVGTAFPLRMVTTNEYFILSAEL